MGENAEVPEQSDPRRVADLYNRIWEGAGDVEEAVFRRVLVEAIDAIEAKDIPYLLTGGMVTAAVGRPRTTNDVDLFVRPTDARGVLHCLEGAGFVTDETDPQWLYKAVKEGVLVDVLFRASGDVLLDDEMVARAATQDIDGRQVPAIAVEDLIFINVLSHEEHTAQHWFDALALLTSANVDWDYLVGRARRRGARRTLSLLLYAQSSDIVVPDRAVKELYEAIYAPGGQA